MIKKDEFNIVLKKYKNSVGEETFNKDIETLIDSFRCLKGLISILDPECKTANEIDELFSVFLKDRDLYKLLIEIPKKYRFINIRQDYYLNRCYEKMRNKIK